MRNRLLLVLGLLLLLMFATVMAALWSAEPKCEFTMEDFRKIQVGMTMEDVSEVLHGPPREHRAVLEASEISGFGSYPPEVSCAYSKEWSSDSLLAVIGFSRDGKVLSAHLLPVLRPANRWDKLRRAIGCDFTPSRFFKTPLH
jgi:hypothetical protein